MGLSKHEITWPIYKYIVYILYIYIYTLYPHVFFMFPICNHNPWPWIIPHGLVRNHRRDSRKIHPRCHQYVQSIPRFTCLPSIRCSWTARTTPHHTATKKNIHKVNKPRMIQLIKSCSCQLSSTFIKASICLKHFTLSLSFFQHLWRFLTQASWPLR